MTEAWFLVACIYLIIGVLFAREMVDVHDDLDTAWRAAWCVATLFLWLPMLVGALLLVLVELGGEGH